MSVAFLRAWSSALGRVHPIAHHCATAVAECPPYGRSNTEPIPHLTVTDGADDATTLEAEAHVRRGLPLETSIASLSLMVFDGAAWANRRQFEFALEVPRVRRSSGGWASTVRGRSRVQQSGETRTTPSVATAAP
jgi:hypothetical protein